MQNPFRYFKTSPDVIRLAVMIYVRFPLSLRQIEDLLFERGIDICHETVRFWWNRFGPLFAAEIRKRRVHHDRYSLWRWHLDETFVKINGEMFYLPQRQRISDVQHHRETDDLRRKDKIAKRILHQLEAKDRPASAQAGLL